MKALALAIDRDPTNWPAYDYLAAMFEEAGNDKGAATVRDMKAKEKAKEQAKKADTLAGFARLATLDVRGTKLTPEGVKKLAAALPKCKIEHDGGTIEPKK